jgi:uncharacterized protein (DUF1330 family)
VTTTPQHIDPTPEQVEALLAAASTSDAPIVMINLLKFNAGSGRDSYLRYAAEVQPHLDRVRGSILYVGDAQQTVIGEQAWWDTIVLVQYPSRAKFLEMVLDPDYQAIAVHRTEALETSGLIATELWDAQY